MSNLQSYTFANEQYLAPPSISTSTHSNNNSHEYYISKNIMVLVHAWVSGLSVSETLVNHFHFLALCCLACFSNKCFTPLFASWDTIALIPCSVLVAGKSCSWTKKLVNTSSGVARTSPMLGHSIGTLRLYELPREVQKLLRGTRGFLPTKI